MSEMLLEHFDLLATAPGGVARLRELILTLAVQGKLVPQDPSDEPASVLLQKIRAEKDRLIAEGKIKRDKPLPPITDEEKPFELPRGWEWVRLGNLLPFRIGRTPSSKDPQFWSGSGHSWVSIADMDHFGVVDHTQRKLTERGAAQFGYEPLPVGTLLMSFKLTIGKIAVLGIPAYHNEAIVSFHPLIGLDTEFLKFILPSVAKTGSSKNALMGQTLNTESLSNLILALPSTAEQSRIVTRVEELMHLCDALEAKGKLDAAQHTQLVQTLLGTLTDSASPAELAANWQRVAEHFDLLLDRPEAVDALEQTILQLAVRGLLVPQDPSDKPASVLLQKIRAEKDRLIAKGKIKRDKPLVPIADEEKPFELPVGWEWVRIAEICSVVTDGEHATPERCADSSQVPLVTAKNVRSEVMDYTVTDYVPKSVAEQCWRRCKPKAGDILMVSVGATLGRLSVLRDPVDMVLVRSVTVLRPVHEGVNVSYLALQLMTPLTQAEIWGSVKQSAQPCLYLAKSAALKVALPPLDEQSRIVARVEELRQFCADLRQRLTASRTTQGHLAEALVEHLAA